MPIIVNATSEHPCLPSLGSLSSITRDRALHQDIRPLEILIVNLMPEKITTERQLAECLGRSPLQINLTFAATDGYVTDARNGKPSTNTPREHIVDFYSSFREICDRKFDGLILTGMNARESTIPEEKIWPDVQKILDWSTQNVTSSLFLCWGAQAALKHFHDIDSIKGDSKLHGVFSHRRGDDPSGLLGDFPDEFLMPVSRWKRPDETKIRANPDLHVVASSDLAGSNIIVENSLQNDGRLIKGRRIYVGSHPEYDNDTLQKEYERDAEKNPQAKVPYNYFPEDNPANRPTNNWRPTGNLYRNWAEQIYQQTPYRRELIPG